jgi:hypothetical protein
MTNTPVEKRFRISALIAAFLVLLMVPLIGDIDAAYQIRRPIIDNGGKINQYYLYAEESGGSTHKGIDFPYPNGTSVYAVADGTVVQLREDRPDGDRGTAWGNFALVRHNQRHYDRTSQQMAYVYSVYLHLKQWSVPVQVGNVVYAGQTKIGEVDDTGSYSQGNHLHQQIVVHPESDRQLEPNTLDSEARSRNPELWLESFNNGGIQTANAVGKVTDANGNPVGGLRIHGIQKPANATWGSYGWSQTYAYAWANADDLLVENFGTTDVQPGIYHLYARYPNGTLYEDLGNHTFVTGRTTFIGLYPAFLPDIMENYYGWNSSIIVRNNSSSKTAQANTTFVWDDGNVPTQKTDYIAPQHTVVVDFPGTCFYCLGSSLAVGSQDQAVIVENRYSGGDYGDGSAAVAYSAFGAGSATMYLPYAVYYPDPDTHGEPFVQYSRFTVQNTATAAASLELKYINRDGVTDFTRFDTLLANSSRTYDLRSPAGAVPDLRQTNYYNAQCGTPAGCNWTGAVKVTSTNGQLITAVLTNYWRWYVAAYNGASGGAQQVFAPSVERRCTDCNPAAGSWQGFSITIVQNLGSSNANVTLRYLNATTGNEDLTISGQTITPNAAKGFNTKTGGNVAAIVYNVLGGAWAGAVMVESSQPLAVTQITIRPDNNVAGAYTGVHSGLASTNTYLPAVYQKNTAYTSCPPSEEQWDQYSILRIQNPTTSNATDVDIYYYDQDGTLTFQESNLTIVAGRSLSRNTRNHCATIPLGGNWSGSVRIQSNQPLVAVAETLKSGQWLASYNSINR